MRQGAVYMNGKLAGILTEISPTEYVFKYDDTYYADDAASRQSDITQNTTGV